eukprot:CAMPEP_0172519844 /NCGR_PEP_ID=MMETSP1066-20121228/291656_1 /TAXON_ID=671091 /ORGANISM="Coscinodiscus wailesii, Strain CCMP2513" /LENGTH=587 /DNA_ID=CAMNT_0013302507 /DNA_START=237 /DNA_END=2001 /DNA_ORIENTATION=-
MSSLTDSTAIPALSEPIPHTLASNSTDDVLSPSALPQCAGQLKPGRALAASPSTPLSSSLPDSDGRDSQPPVSIDTAVRKSVSFESAHQPSVPVTSSTLPPPSSNPYASVPPLTKTYSIPPVRKAYLSLDGPDNQSHANASTVRIEHVNKNREQGVSDYITGCLCQKKMLCLLAMVAIYAVLATAGGSYLLRQYLSAPNFEQTIRRLNAEVEELSGEVTRLSSEIDELSAEVDRLNVSNAEYERLNGEMKKNNALFQENNELLREQNERYTKLNLDLRETQEELENTNANLTSNVDMLGVQLSNLTLANSNFKTQVGNLASNNSALSNQVQNLQELNVDLAKTKSSLNSTVTELRNENEQYKLTNENLTDIVSFLNTTAASIDKNFDDIVDFLTSQITTQRTQLLRSLQLSYDEKIASWTCNMNVAFGAQNFVRNPDTPLGVQNYRRVINYLDEKWLQQLCLNETNFESYLASTLGTAELSTLINYLDEKWLQQLCLNETNFESYLASSLTTKGGSELQSSSSSSSVADITYQQLTEAVNHYYKEAEDHYFPDGGTPPEGAVTHNDWADAGYECKNLAAGLQFSYPL